jgi:hypothetical protein
VETSITILILLAVTAFGGWAAVRLAALIRSLMKITSGLTGLGVEIGRLTETAEHHREAQHSRFGAG